MAANFVGGFYILLALLGLGLLIFIHELGHYLVAKWVGMRVEVFSIGFGKPFYSWKRGDVTWQICWLPFGGYVRMAGMEEKDGVKPEDMADGFFGKSPWDRIKVAVAGPVVNLVFALILFAGLWAAGGREKAFSQHTHVIGWVDQQSDLFQKGVRTGDIITSYDGHPFKSEKDHLHAPMLGGKKVKVEGFTVDPKTGERTPFEHLVSTYPHPDALVDGLKTLGVMAPANYLVYDRLPDGTENPLHEKSPLRAAGLEYGDRVYWVDGEVIYSTAQLSYILNSGHVMLTVERDGAVEQIRVPRIAVEELKLDSEHRDELVDWQYESNLTKTKINKLFYIPYNLNDSCVVEESLPLIDPERNEQVFPKNAIADSNQILRSGDRILAVDGKQVQLSYQLFSHVQDHQVHVIVDRSADESQRVSWTEADALFIDYSKSQDLEKIVQSIGTNNVISTSGGFALLNPVRPIQRIDLAADADERALIQTQMMEQRKQFEMLPDPQRREQALAALDKAEKEYLLGFSVQDRRVQYNPGPLALYAEVGKEIWRMLSSLFTGALSPKWVSGPIGIVR